MQGPVSPSKEPISPGFRMQKTGLRARIVVLFIFTVVVILNLASWAFYSRTRDYFDTELGKTLIGLAKSGADVVDADLIGFLKPGYEGGEFYKDLQLNLEFLKRDFAVDRLFIIDTTFETLVDTDPDSPIGFSPPHLKINLVEVNAALGGQAAYSTLYRGYDDNLYKSAYAPIFNKNGEVAAIVCVDASPAFLQVIERIAHLILTLNIISILVSIVISLVLARSILRPVHLLVAAAGRVSRGDFSQPVQIAARHEIGFLARVFNSMQENIKTKEENLKELKLLAEGKAESIQSYNDYILRSIQHGVLTCDLDGTITIINPAAERILELSHKQVAGQKYSAAFDEAHPFSSFMSKALQAIPRRTTKEIEITLPGNHRVLSVEASPLVDAKHHTIGVNFVITDLTEIRKLQDSVREKERLAYLGELSATVAHEVRNPLNSIELFVGLLKRRVNSQGDREEAIGKIQHEIRALNSFINNFLMFARPTELRVNSIRVSKLFQEVLFLAWKELQEKEIDVRVNVQDQKLKIKGDAEQLKRAFLNVVLNAVQSMEMHGTLSLTAKSCETHKPKGKVQIEIADTGSGIDPKNRERVFQPFYSTRSQGTGLGLAIVKNIIHAHDGTIIVENSDPRGAKFIFYL